VVAEYLKPLPRITDDNRQYWEYCKNHELRMQKCFQCAYIRFPCSILCPKCHSMEAQWVKLSGKGVIYSYVIYRRAYHPAYQNDIPYVVAIIQLIEGPRMESNIIDCKMERLKIDLPVEVIFEDVTEKVALPKFKPVIIEG
jgi:uncharacterized OB-fold protein